VNAEETQTEVFVARQPIFDRHRHVYAYELLFRSGLKNAFGGMDPDRASIKVIADGFIRFGLQRLTGGKRAFINFTRDTLVKGYATLLPKDSIVVEILEDVEQDPEVFDACRALKQRGYMIALDDVVCDDWDNPLVGFADIIKVDFRGSDARTKAALPGLIAARKIKALAEKIETRAEFDEAVALGYTYLQGYFFSKPLVLSGRDVPAVKQRYLELLREINRTDLDFADLEDVIKREPSLTYKLMTYINSVAFSFRSRITSVRQSLALLGEDAVRKWASVVALAALAHEQPSELLVSSLIRARFCEVIAASVKLEERGQELFLMGLFSLLDAITGRPMHDVLANLPLADDIKMALLGNRNRLRDVLACVLAYEQAEWETFGLFAAKLRLDEGETVRIYLEAVVWATSSYAGANGSR
jgi:EAL and modified HD-GYP domain-containing signal transduction protein